MWRWLTGKKKQKAELPTYSGLQSNPCRGLPPELDQREASESFTIQRDALEQGLLEPARRPPLDEALFTQLLAIEGGILTIDLPDSTKCLPIFSTPIRAADYKQTVLDSGPATQYLCSTPLEFVRMLGDIKGAGIETFALDRCPRCDVFSAISAASINTADDMLTVWAISKATELARADTYLEFAVESAHAGQLVLAREVALETVGHVTLEDPRCHLLLGQIGVGLGDRKLVQEAKAFLRFLELDAWEQELDRVVETGTPDFSSAS